uniref:Zinc finger ZPR1-type domain-containing protein n=1 Tax=Parascaris equorum TaxID=6256 RepID=A0A914S212_PAREQ
MSACELGHHSLIGDSVSLIEETEEQGSFLLGDSADSQDKHKMSEFLENFDAILSLKKKAHLVLDDPAGNSYIQSLAAPLDDSRLEKIFYTRSFEQNDELGLNDMRTENYEELEMPHRRSPKFFHISYYANCSSLSPQTLKSFVNCVVILSVCMNRRRQNGGLEQLYVGVIPDADFCPLPPPLPSMTMKTTQASDECLMCWLV